MPIKASGTLAMTEIVAEFADTPPHALSEFYRGGGKVPATNVNVPASGQIAFSNFYGAANRVVAVQTYSVNTTQTTLNVSTLSGYAAGSTDVYVYVSSNVYVYSTSVASPALTITGAAAGDVIYLVNNGFIIGKGGDGVYGGSGDASTAGNPAGPALSLGYSISLTNNSYIAGGGGSGAAPGFAANALTGGGAGGGNGAGAGFYGGGQGGAPGQPGSAGTSSSGNFPGYGGGGGGGRVLPGTGGAGSVFPTKPGGGGAGGGSTVGGYGGGSGASGGSAGNAGGDAGGSSAGGGGGWGARGGNTAGGLYGGFAPGGTGGKAINLNGYTVTYITTGTLYGAVS